VGCADPVSLALSAVSYDQHTRIGIGKGRFSVFAAEKYNCSMI